MVKLIWQSMSQQEKMYYDTGNRISSLKWRTGIKLFLFVTDTLDQSAKMFVCQASAKSDMCGLGEESTLDGSIWKVLHLGKL
jgi:hypothetical protein